MENSSVWAIIWFAAAAALGAGEIMVAGSFFLIPFAAGAVAAALASLFLNPFVGLILFPIVSLAAFVGLRPYARRLEESSPDVAGIGANRLIGAEGVVLAPISATPGGPGMVRVGTEEWRADSLRGNAVAQGQIVQVVEVQGTRLVVDSADVPFVAE